MMMQRDAERHVLRRRRGGRPALSRAAARSAARFCPSADSGGSLPSAGSTISDVRRFKAIVALAAVQTELREVVVHVGDGAGFGLLALRRGRLLGDFERFLRV